MLKVHFKWNECELMHEKSLINNYTGYIYIYGTGTLWISVIFEKNAKTKLKLCEECQFW